MRKVLVHLTTTVSLLGLVLVSYPFLMSLSPSEKALGTNPVVVIDLNLIPEGQAKYFDWAGLPIVVLHRSPAQLAELKEIMKYRMPPMVNTPLVDPANLIPQLRSVKPEYFVAIAWTGYTGPCGSNFKQFEKTENYLIHTAFYGFIENCRGMWHDTTGRPLEGSWAGASNLPIPAHQFLPGNRIKIGPPDLAVSMNLGRKPILPSTLSVPLPPILQKQIAQQASHVQCD